MSNEPPRIPPGSGGRLAAGLTLDSRDLLAAENGERLYDLPRLGNVHLLHFTDCHAQLLPIWFREPNVNIGFGGANRQAAAPGGRIAAQGLRHQARLERGACVHLPGFRPGGEDLRQGRWLLPIWPPWSSACAPVGRARCCWMAAIPGRARPPRSGPRARTWSMPANCSAWT